MKKSQAATEFLIVLSIIFIIALIILGVTGAFPQFSVIGKNKAYGSYWEKQVVGLKGYAVDKGGNFKVVLINNGKRTVNITRVEVGTTGEWALGTFCTYAPCLCPGGQCPFPIALIPGGVANITETRKIHGPNRCIVNQPYEYEFNITYVDVDTKTKHEINGNGGEILLLGTCVNFVP